MGGTAVPMRDGVRLATGLHLAEQDGRWPASLLRTGIRQTGVGGPARACGTGRPLSAAFARVLRIADGRVCKLVQITHAARWNDALGASGNDEAQTPGWHR